MKFTNKHEIPRFRASKHPLRTNVSKIHSIALAFDLTRFTVFVNCVKLKPIPSDCHSKRLRTHPNLPNGTK